MKQYEIPRTPAQAAVDKANKAQSKIKQRRVNNDLVKCNGSAFVTMISLEDGTPRFLAQWGLADKDKRNSIQVI